MNRALNLLLKMGIASGLQERDVVIDRISTVLQDKIGTDPEKAQKVGEQILNGLEGLKDQLTIEQIIAGITRNDDELEKRIGELTEAVNRLNIAVEKLTEQQKDPKQ
jgi:hypothetical protein